MENIYKALLDEIAKYHPVSLKTEIQGTEGMLSDGIRRSLAEVQVETDGKGRRYAGVTVERGDGMTTVCEPVLPPERLIVLGGGHIALPVCEFAAKCGFSVTVVDDRIEFANRARFPEAEEVICDSFVRAIGQIHITPYDYVVIITRGHRFDADCLRAIIPGTEPAYLGMIGSRRRVRGLMAMLKEEGYNAERLDKVCTPIGLNIGAVTPGEIAISILSEVIAHKRLSEYGGPDRFCNDSDIELAILAYLAENREPKAIVTVLETKGSTPREAGARMTVSPLGKVTGSIGGGCSEAAIIQDAIHIIGTGKYLIRNIDLTDEVAEEDGMVCGGVMQVLIEDGSGEPS